MTVISQNHYDAIVVGSGISGGWAAKELTERGLKVLMLERGRDIKHIEGYTNTFKESWDYPHHNIPTLAMKKDNPEFSKSWLFDEANHGMFANDVDHPYQQDKPFAWLRGYHMGGRSLLWGRKSFRFNEEDFLANAKDGFGVDWPIRYADITPWYSYVERFAGISGSKDGLDVLPDGEFQAPMPLNVVEKEVAARLKKAYKGQRHLLITRVANMTEAKPDEGRTSCQYRNKCRLGCPFGAYFSTQSSTLPAAMKTGNLTVRPFSIVTQLLYDKDKKRAVGVEVLDSETNQTVEFTSKLIFLNASAFNSTWILMNSATDVWDGGLGSSSGELGHNVMDHHVSVGARASIEGFDDKTVYGRRPTGFYIPRFRNWGTDKRDYVRGFGYQGQSRRGGWQKNTSTLGIGVELKNALSEPGGWSINLGGYGEILPYHDNRIYLNQKVTDKWGLPTLNINVDIKSNEQSMRKDMRDDAVEMLEAAGLKNVRGFLGNYKPGVAIHEMGTARMGRDPKTSVLNQHNQLWDAPNVFVTDGACMTSSSCVNPSLTYMALTARAAAFAVDELKRGNL